MGNFYKDMSELNNLILEFLKWYFNEYTGNTNLTILREDLCADEAHPIKAHPNLGSDTLDPEL